MVPLTIVPRYTPTSSSSDGDVVNAAPKTAERPYDFSVACKAFMSSGVVSVGLRCAVCTPVLGQGLLPVP